MLQDSRSFPAHPESVGDARSYVDGVLTEWGLQIEVAGLIVSELATNAVFYGLSNPFRIAVEAEGSRVRLKVFDRNHAQPVVRDPGLRDEHGRGLQVVDALGAAWGVEPSESGKVVWVEMTVDAE